ncbi:prephenate dehydrogenase/arogenate dehydrogenase family protein [Isoptericola sp. BMS4]|uniref:prephenate dehydrogenase n=1 Tax=Isoptericola sp. BMS4 TaxID=2527875 RepID=UPI0014221D4B|nr:prephenate dehydrogenase/arogenate dehydrogenase family protein [Isoptericola sp. BMS4]
MTAAAPTTVGVVGLGLIGGSLARLLASRDVEVVTTDVDPAARAAARAAGLPVADDVAGVCGARPEVLVLAVPLRAVPATAEAVASAVDAADGPGPTVTDVGSVKGPVRAAVEAAGLGPRYVGAHPMAGTEHSGFDASSRDLLDGAAWAVTVAEGTGTGGAPGTDPDRLAQVLALVTGPLAGTAAVVTDEQHDEATALVSHVPHVVATQLLNAVAGAPVRDLALGLAAGSFRDGTRVARTDPARTEAMVVQNAAWVAPALRKVVRDLEVVVAALETNAPLHGFFHAADDVRAGRLRDADAERVTSESLIDGWPRRLVERCGAGAVVVGMDPGSGDGAPGAARLRG